MAEIFGSNDSSQPRFLITAILQVTDLGRQWLVLVQITNPGVASLVPHLEQPDGIRHDLAIFLSAPLSELQQGNVSVPRGKRPLSFNRLCIKPLLEILPRDTFRLQIH